MRACPTPWATPPWICPLRVRGLITVPTSSTTTYRSRVTAPVSGSTSTSQTWQPLGHVACLGATVPVSSNPRRLPAGRRGALGARAPPLLAAPRLLRPRHGQLAVGEHDVRLRRLQELGSDLPALGDPLIGRGPQGGAADHGGARAHGAHAKG